MSSMPKKNHAKLKILIVVLISNGNNSDNDSSLQHCSTFDRTSFKFVPKDNPPKLMRNDLMSVELGNCSLFVGSA